jgi:hypothetical protein
MDTNEHELKRVTANRCSVFNLPFKFSIRVLFVSIRGCSSVFVLFTYCRNGQQAQLALSKNSDEQELVPTGLEYHQWRALVEP